MAAETGSHTEECRGLLLLVKAFDKVRKVEVSQIVAVIGQKILILSQVLLNSLQSLTNIGLRARVNKRDCPVVDIRVEYL